MVALNPQRITSVMALPTVPETGAYPAPASVAIDSATRSGREIAVSLMLDQGAGGHFFREGDAEEMEHRRADVGEDA